MDDYSTNEEMWEDIEGYEGTYQVSNQGRVRSLDRHIIYNTGVKRFHKGKILTPEIDRYGYERVDLRESGKHNKQFVHRIVAKAFIPNPEEHPVINHKNEQPTDNRVSNLEWCTVEYNHGYGNARKKNGDANKKQVIGIHKDTGKVIEFNSVNETGEKGFTRTRVSSAANNNKLYRGYYWKFK